MGHRPSRRHRGGRGGRPWLAAIIRLYRSRAKADAREAVAGQQWIAGRGAAQGSCAGCPAILRGACHSSSGVTSARICRIFTWARSLTETAATTPSTSLRS